MRFCNLFLSLFISVLLVNSAIANENCFLAREDSKVLVKEGACDIRHRSGCDFSIAVSLMGFDAGILVNENSPVWPYKKGYPSSLNIWKKAHTPRTWILDSCIWYSGNIVELLGPKKIESYIRKLGYGNQDVSGINRENWRGNLLISAKEQVDFLERVIQRKLDVSHNAYLMTEKILFVQDLPGGWKLYGKTGTREEVRLPSKLYSSMESVSRQDAQILKSNKLKQIGWFIGWIKKDQRRIPFASCVVLQEKQDTPASFIARNNALTKLFWLINGLER